jgi:hypothetical protein
MTHTWCYVTDWHASVRVALTGLTRFKRAKKNWLDLFLKNIKKLKYKEKIPVSLPDQASV